MMTYIGFLPPRDFRDIYAEHVEGLAEMFDLEKLREKKRTPHVTVQRPFDTENITGVEKVVRDICAEQPPLDLNLDSYGRFDKRVVYFSLRPSREALNLRKKLQQELSKLGIKPTRYDKGELHISLAKEAELEGKFDEVWGYLSERNFELPLRVENIAIFRKEKDWSRIHRIYKLKGSEKRYSES